jgi:hypothetical protein
VTRTLGAPALVMVGSVLLPTRPLDGAFIAHRLTKVVISVMLVIASGLLLLGLL